MMIDCMTFRSIEISGKPSCLPFHEEEAKGREREGLRPNIPFTLCLS